MALPAFLPTSPERYAPLLREIGALPKPHQEKCLKILDKYDLYFLLRFTLTSGLIRSEDGRSVWEKPWLFDRCREVQNEPDGCLDLWAREHYKSTIITYGLSIQDILKDAEETIGIFSHTRPIAKAFLRKIKNEFTKNEKLKRRHATVLWANPEAESPKWNEDEGIVVRRKGNPAESTVEAWGLTDGQPISKHFRKRIYDDCVVRDSVNTPDMMLKTEEMWALSTNLGTEGGVERYIGTRYHFGDLYKLIMDRGVAKPRIHPALNPPNIDGEPVLQSREYLMKKYKNAGPYVFASQQLVNPVADDAQGFKVEWLAYYDAEPYAERAGKNIYILVDPAGTKGKRSDYTAIWVVGLGADQNFYVLDGIRDRLNLTERVDALFALHALWKPIEVRYEAYGLASDTEHIRYRQEKMNYRFKVTEVRGSINKEARIRRLVGPMQEGRFYFPKNGIRKKDHQKRPYELVKVFIDEELAAFPVGSHDDLLDALARILEPDLPLNWPMFTGKKKRPANYDAWEDTIEPKKDRGSWLGA